MVYGLWFMVYGFWCVIDGLWFMVYGLWFTVYGSLHIIKVYGSGSRRAHGLWSTLVFDV
jgi:hypothetical protein